MVWNVYTIQQLKPFKLSDQLYITLKSGLWVTDNLNQIYPSKNQGQNWFLSEMHYQVYWK